MTSGSRAISFLFLAGLALGAYGLQSKDVPKDAAKPAPPSALEPEARLRTIARMIVQVEIKHRTQVAEIERLIRVFEKERKDAELRLAIDARHIEADDHRARLLELERDLGPELYARFRAAFDADVDREPPLRARMPEPPPPPPMLPHEIEAQDAAKRASERDADQDAGRAEEDGGGGGR